MKLKLKYKDDVCTWIECEQVQLSNDGILYCFKDDDDDLKYIPLEYLKLAQVDNEIIYTSN